MEGNQGDVTRVDSRTLNLPSGLIRAELEGLYGTNVLSDMKEIIDLYDIYERGAPFPLETQGDYVPANLKYKSISALVNKEARFLFSKPPDFWVDVNIGNSKEEREQAKTYSSIYQRLVDRVIEQNNLKGNLVKAAKDCFIGKRIAILYNINETSGIQISFLPSLEFIYDVDPSNTQLLTKIVVFYGLNEEKARVNQRIYKKKYWMEGGYCHYLEEIYDGAGNLVEEVQGDTSTKFTFIPAWVIVNDGLTGDLIGTSEIENLKDYEGWYSKMASADLDAERTGMNPIRWARDMSPGSTQNLSIAAGAFWDLSTDQNAAEGVTGEVGVLDSPMGYSAALETTLSRIKNMMYEQTSVPNVNSEALKGVVSSGKTLQAIYWDLIVRCEEKMLDWRPALESMTRCIIEGVRNYPTVAKLYLDPDESLPDVDYSIRVDNQYPLPENEQEEKQIDLAEVNAQTMSKKYYMKKWRNLTDEEVEEELHQIAAERQLLEDSFFEPPLDTSDLGNNPPNEGE